MSEQEKMTVAGFEGDSPELTQQRDAALRLADRLEQALVSTRLSLRQFHRLTRSQSGGFSCRRAETLQPILRST